MKISVGPVKTETKFIPCTHNPEWNRCFAIGKDKIQGGTCELSVWDAVSWMLRTTFPPRCPIFVRVIWLLTDMFRIV